MAKRPQRMIRVDLETAEAIRRAGFALFDRTLNYPAGLPQGYKERCLSADEVIRLALLALDGAEQARKVCGG